MVDSDNKKFFESEDLEEGGETKNPTFNFAIDSLGSITLIHRSIISNSVRPDLDDTEKQKVKIILIKSLLSSAIPLAPKQFDEAFRKKILNFQPKIKKSSSLKGGIIKNQTRFVFCWNLDKELFESTIKIFEGLQKEGYFMPKGDDSRDF